MKGQEPRRRCPDCRGSLWGYAGVLCGVSRYMSGLLCGCPNDKLIRISGTYHPPSYEEEEVFLVGVFL